VTIFGDYDVDGATSAALLVRLLRALDVPVGAYIPDRLMEGYGPSGAALVRIGEAGSKLIVTVDCGAQAFDALQMAADAAIDVVVVDHHKCAAALPVAHALVNPNRLDEVEGAAHGHLAAVGVAFLLGAALLRTLRARGWFAGRPEPKLLDLLDLVALGTVADVAALRGLNRAFVAQGLKVMAQRRNPGIAALITASRLTRAPTATDLGFALGPRINAGGRVGRSDLGVRLLTTEDPDEAREIAEELDRLNEERRAIEGDVQAAAEAMDGGRAVAVVAGEGWHPGVIGIVAGRLKEKFGRPAIVIAIDEAGVGKGSGRSIPGVDLGAAILMAKDMGLLVAGGGHAMAAGLTIAADRVTEFAAFLDSHLADAVERASADRALLLDAVLAPGGVCPDLVTALDAGGPYGMGWPAPRVAAGPVRIVKASIVGNGHVRAVVSGDDGRSLKAMAFRAADTPLGAALLGAPPHRRLWLAGRARIDDWSSRPAAELHVDDAAWCD
jgi:single-stranded-DNA-specific exonuclease